MNGADLLCDTLLANEVDTCFANPGTSEMHFVAALDRKPAMRCVLGLSEGVVTGAADGYARMADRPAATLLHLGPGLANGLANLHNARRARSPIVNIVGEHATWHLAADAPLTTDIESLARPMSGSVRRITSVERVSEDGAAAIAAARGLPGGVATLILPADAAWSEVTEPAVRIAPPRLAGRVEAEVVDAAARCLRNGRKTLLLLSGAALRAPALALAHGIARATGARVLAQQSNGRVERGAGRPPVGRVLYGVEAALRDLAEIQQVVLVSARAPVAFFAYPGLPSSVLPAHCEVSELAHAGQDALDALQALARALGVRPGEFPIPPPQPLPAMPSGPLTAESIAAVTGILLPEHAIVCDEAITSGHAFFRMTESAAPHDFLALTGGAIGSGLPMATGAAIACPDRRVVALQADGSGMFTLQALWTQARERLNVTTVIFANRGYAILHKELQAVGAGTAGHNARRMLDVVDPTLDWTSLAAGMGVEACRVDSNAAFADAFRYSLQRPGPFLIEAAI